MSPDFSTSAGPSHEMGPETGDESGTDRAWRIADMSPGAVEAARAGARRAGIPLAVWLSGLIHAVADHEEAEDDPVPGE
jgi:hypothetical protein